MVSKRKYLKGFTIAEVLITLVLTSIAITLSYSTLNYIQKLFSNYKDQNEFINEYTEFKTRMNYESLKAKYILEQDDNSWVIVRDSSEILLHVLETTIVMKNALRTDSFHLVAKKLKKGYEKMNNPGLVNKLLNNLEFEIEFSKQKFIFYFYKTYDSAIKLNLDKEE